jgi:hypothetical protein
LIVDNCANEEKKRLKESLFLHEQRYLILFTPFGFEKQVKSKLFFTYSFFHLSLLAYLVDRCGEREVGIAESRAERLVARSAWRSDKISKCLCLNTKFSDQREQ